MVDLEQAADAAGTVRVTETGVGRFQQLIEAAGRKLWADEPVAMGGRGTAPDPYALVLAGLGACTNMTLRLYADRKGWPLEKVEVSLRHQRSHERDCEHCDEEEARLDGVSRVLTLHGPLDAEQRARLLDIAEKCPVHRTLAGGIHVHTTLAE